MALTLKLRQGTKAQLGTLEAGMTLGEPLYVTDTLEVFVATGATTKRTIALDLNDFDALAHGDVHADDLIYMYDVSVASTSPKARKITFDNFKTALNIPAGSTDEKVATASGQTAGYLGTNGTDGVLRVNTAGLAMAHNTGVTTLALSFASQAQGDIIYRGATDWARLETGTAGQILRAGGAGANPSWISLIDGGTFS
jgi:hypothetical protein